MHAVYETCAIVNAAKNLKQTTVHRSFGNITIIGTATWNRKDELQQRNAANAWLTTRSSSWRRIHVLNGRRRNTGSNWNIWIFGHVHEKIELCRDSRI
jgi:hypothetical protein